MQSTCHAKNAGAQIAPGKTQPQGEEMVLYPYIYIKLRVQSHFFPLYLCFRGGDLRTFLYYTRLF